ncbi:DUF499 domain-containing protein [Nitrospiraceae bacterium AH_259_D15_M11_P09]|nr:DUF499 domain-containing protein [Nitrospiraceae bacterium AH_259_D15_M11_P09]
MKPLKQLCTPRESVFDHAKRDTVLNLGHLTAHKIAAKGFFEENYVTEGMKTLLTEAFRRLQKKSEQAVFKLTQAMGGGKTHNLITLGMLAEHPEFRSQVLPDLPGSKELPPVRVVAFSGRETDIPHGIWGEIARQLGKFDTFKEYYAPLRAPGRTAWINLLKGEPTLILLDELPPYLDNAKSVAIGNSDLAKVTATALTNLIEAVVESELSNVCVVLTDLVGTYAEASAQIAAVLQQLQSEAQRHSMNLTPVQINTDEFYHILRKRLFQALPKDAQIDEVAQAYAKTVREAKQMDITAQSPEQFAQLIKSSYPFHPAIKDLYARFRENSGFQQTRALIRLMRIIASRLWQSGEADKKHLISVQDIDLNDPETLSEIRQINASLENAVAHDIASQGKAVAETMDQNLGSSDARDVCRLIFMASLANVPNAVLGLSIPELVGYLCAPGRNLGKLRGDVLEKLATAAWYLHSNRDGKLFFKNVENLNAKLESLARTYVREQSLKELRQRLTELFKPVNRWCYQEILPLPAIDEINLAADHVSLVISEPFVGQGLNPQLKQFFDQTTFKNRVAFLTGSRNTFDSLIESAKRLKAIQHIIDEMNADKVPPTDPQFKQADELLDRLLGQFLSAVKETFSTLYYPTRQGDKDALNPADFLMKFEGNKYDGEDQVLQVLKDKQKYTEDVSSDIFRKKVEQRLFTTPVMLWSEIEKRAAINPQWQWHRRDALDALKDDLVHKEVWREDDAGYVDRSPPPPKTSTVQIQERSRDEDTGALELKVIPINGDTVYAEIGGEATTASKKVENGLFTTDEIEVSFLAVDSTGVHPNGPAVTWKNRVTLKYRLYASGQGEKMLELKAAPNKDGKTAICYTTDGSDPKLGGGSYGEPVAIRKGTYVVLAFAECEGVQSGVLQIPIDWSKAGADKPIDPQKPAVWRRRHEYYFTTESYEFIDRLKRHEAKVSAIKVSIIGDRWAELTLHELIELTSTQLSEAVEAVRKLPEYGQVGVEAGAIHFPTGQRLLDWLNETKADVKAGEVKQ